MTRDCTPPRWIHIHTPTTCSYGKLRRIVLSTDVAQRLSKVNRAHQPMDDKLAISLTFRYQLSLSGKTER